MKFSVVIGNPPYNEASSATWGEEKGTKHKRKTKFIGKDFMERYAAIADFAAILLPTRGYWMGKNHNSTKRRLKKLGLRAVRATDAFTKTVNLADIGVYYFERGYNGEIVDDFNRDWNIPENNLGDILIYGSNSLIGGKLKDQKYGSGKDTLYITSKRDVIENVDVSHIDDPTRGSWRVILSQIAGKDTYGSPVLIRPNDVITYSVVCWEVDSPEQGEKLIEYLNKEETKQIAAEFRVTAANSKHNFSIIPTPDFMDTSVMVTK